MSSSNPTRPKSKKYQPDSDSWYNLLTIRFENGEEESFFIELTRTGTFLVPDREKDSDWTRLDFHKCPCCPLKSEETEHCPAAESLESTLMKLRDRYSYERVTAKLVDWAGRSTTVNWQLQEVGSIFVQLAVFSSNCPVGKQFKQLLKDLRPFATNEELSKHLISKFLLKHRGEIEQTKKDILQKMEPIRVVFSQLSKRLASDTGGDAIANSIVRLDAFALNISLYLEEVLEEVKVDMGWSYKSPLDEEGALMGDDSTLKKPHSHPPKTKSLIANIKDLISGKKV